MTWLAGLKLPLNGWGTCLTRQKTSCKSRSKASTTAVTDYSNAVANWEEPCSLHPSDSGIMISKNVITESDTALKAQEIVTLYPDMGAQIDTTV